METLDNCKVLKEEFNSIPLYELLDRKRKEGYCRITFGFFNEKNKENWNKKGKIKKILAFSSDYFKNIDSYEFPAFSYKGKDVSLYSFEKKYANKSEFQQHLNEWNIKLFAVLSLNGIKLELKRKSNSLNDKFIW